MKIEDILLIILIITSMILILWYLLGQSPTLDQILLGIMLANLGFTFKIYGDMRQHLGEHKGKEE